MKGKKILLTTFFVVLLMLLTPCISALNIQTTKNTDVKKNVEKSSEEIYEKEEMVSKTDLKEKITNFLEKFGDGSLLFNIIFRLAGITMLTGAIVASFVPFPGAIEITYVGLYGTIAALWGFFSFEDEIGTRLTRAALGYKLAIQGFLCTLLMGIRLLTYDLEEDLLNIMDGPAFEEAFRLWDIVILGSPISSTI